MQPVELARKLAKEMDENKTVSVAHTYVPNQYAVYLSPSDREQFTSYEAALKKELSDYLLEHARGQGLALVTRPTVALETDERLGLGEFGIQAWLSDEAAAEIGAASEEAVASEMAPSRGEFGHTRVYSPDRESPRELSSLGLITERPLLVGDGKRTVLAGDRLLMGRSRECDLVLDDPNVSRRHAEMRRSGGRWIVVDLGSTNGVRVNGKRIQGEAPLSPGDQITLGVSKLTFELE